MPYIKQRDRDVLDRAFGFTIDEKTGISHALTPQTPGELNYLFTKIISSYVQANGLDYRAINDVMGALEGAKCEFYRRVAAPYEEKKIKENGDVYSEET